MLHNKVNYTQFRIIQMQIKQQGFLLLLLFFIGSSCNSQTEPPIPEQKIYVEKTAYQAKVHPYEEIGMLDFFSNLIENHRADYHVFFQKKYFKHCESLGLNPSNEKNRKQYYDLKILHDLLTSRGAYDCSVGKIWNIPYFWHWIEENPRHQIFLKSNNQLIKDLDPPKEFSKYKSLADIDRTPFLFLSELFVKEDKYYVEDCQSFSTFGWCSEREMAFSCLLNLLDYKAEVIVESGHSWTELIISMKTKEGFEKLFLVTIDNTFDDFFWEPISEESKLEWESKTVSSKTQKWCNAKVQSKEEQEKIKKFVVLPEVSKMLETRVVNYLNQQY